MRYNVELFLKNLNEIEGAKPDAEYELNKTKSILEMAVEQPWINKSMLDNISMDDIDIAIKEVESLFYLEDMVKVQSTGDNIRNLSIKQTSNSYDLF